MDLFTQRAQLIQVEAQNQEKLLTECEENEMSNQTTAEFLTQQSKEICDMNHCTEDEHFCESYAYFNKEHILLDLCYPDYFQGCSEPFAAIPLPWTGTQKDLEEEIDNQIAESES